MRNGEKKIVSIVMASAMVLGLVACGSSGGTTTSSSNGGNDDQQEMTPLQNQRAK